MRLIDADALTIDLFKKAMDDALLTGNADMHSLLIQVVAHYPTIDAVEVVRCKDCKHRPYRDDDGRLDGDYVCPYLCDDPFYSIEPIDSWFCHRGERKEDDETD